MMSFFTKRNTTITIAVSAIVIVCVTFYLMRNKTPETSLVNEIRSVSSTQNIIGKSVEGREIIAYTFKPLDPQNTRHLVFVGGIHGGYEWNSVLLAYKMIDHIKQDSEIIPENLTVTIIPSLNPDGVYKITGKEGYFTASDIPIGKDLSAGRFNANKVDLNRNFDCKWQKESTWKQTRVSAGTKPFSEPEALAIKEFIETEKPVAVIFWHSQSGAVYASQCENGILPETLNIMNEYASASGYKAVPKFDAYETTGDSEAWLADIGIPSVTVELSTHENMEWEKNLAGVKALFEYYKKKL